MYCVIQFYVQMRTPLAEHQPFMKVLAIKLVIFLSFWQSTAISLGTSTLHVVHASSVIAYPDIVVGIPSLLLCFEMACFAIFHLWAFPYRPYKDNARQTFYPVADPDGPDATPKPNEHMPRSGGFLGVRAIFHAMNIWDVVKAFGRGIRWLFVGVRNRRNDVSYQAPLKTAEMDMDDLSPQKFHSNGVGGVIVGNNVDTAYRSNFPGMKSIDHLPIATQFRRSRFDSLTDEGGNGVDLASSSANDIGIAITQGGSGTGISGNTRRQRSDEAAGLIAYAQPMSSMPAGHNNYDDSPERYRDQDNIINNNNSSSSSSSINNNININNGLRGGANIMPGRGGVYNDDVYGSDESSTAYRRAYDGRGRSPPQRALVQQRQPPPRPAGGRTYPEDTQWGEAI